MKSLFAAVFSLGLVGLATPAHAQYVTYYAPSYVAAPVTTYYAPSVATTAYYAPTVAYYAPTTAYYAPTTAYYAPAVTTAYYAPAVTTAYYAPAVTTAYYAPAVTSALTRRPTRTRIIAPTTCQASRFATRFVAGRPVPPASRAVQKESNRITPPEFLGGVFRFQSANASHFEDRSRFS